MTNFRLVQIERDDNFNFVENGRKLSRQVENTMGKVETARYEPFLLFSQGFQKICTAYKLKPGLVCERINLENFLLYFCHITSTAHTRTCPNFF